MNSLLQLKCQFEHKKNNRGYVVENLPNDARVMSNHIFELRSQLEDILKYWISNTLIDGALFSAYYNKVVAKSNRIKSLFGTSYIKANDLICGARFTGNGKDIRHVFAYYMSLDLLKEAIRRLSICGDIVQAKYGGEITKENIENLYKLKNFDKRDISLTSFIRIIIDCYYVSKFSIDDNIDDINEPAIVSLYKTKRKTIELLESIGIRIYETGLIDDTTVLLNPNQYKILKEKAPYLVSMQVSDIACLTKDEVSNISSNTIKIPAPTNEPIIGVIDTLFYKDVYFKDWVEYENMLDPNIPIELKDYYHGTEVSSIIVDGPSFNPGLNDECGRFRVKHFGVAIHGRFSSFSVLKNIRTAVAANRDIKVWNLSLGSVMEIHKNFISPEAAELDKIQSEYDVIFVVAGTNKPIGAKENMRIGAPADSINSLVVNSVKESGAPASYTRVGPVLSFFHKPDVSYYGGDRDNGITVCTPVGQGIVQGTSFAAPWIARKLAYLIHYMGMTREVAKALIIDSAADWNRKDNLTHSVGYGVVPIKISDILKSKDDEIKFFMTGTIDKYETYNYNIPVPTYNDKHPFFARATLCYFPNCSRKQGVDYTDTEMDINFGRVREGKKGVKIDPINNNIQDVEGKYLYEGPARLLYRKWDNIKHISETIKSNARPREKYGAGLWGLSVKIKERLKYNRDHDMQFGVVITLKEMNGVNRIDDFINMCHFRGLIVNRINIDARIDVYARAEENIEFDK